ncbi:hypothetical protein [Secundilactobacillus collinoides]|uniref:hypothetical protein n=1 Tax=Secundilactobacillus collinoides TaxID=33960 RepID=UPI000B1AA5FF|nr:hypothetical protein [Secundilactobacillus collinoides]
MHVKLEAALEAITFADEDGSYYFKKTGEIVLASSALDGDLECNQLDAYPDESIDFSIIFEIDDQQIMADFTNRLATGQLPNVFDRSMRGRGAFHRFCNTLNRFEITDRRYLF